MKQPDISALPVWILCPACEGAAHARPWCNTCNGTARARASEHQFLAKQPRFQLHEVQNPPPNG